MKDIERQAHDAIQRMVADLNAAGLYVVVWTDGNQHHIIASSDARWLDEQRYNVQNVPITHTWHPATPLA